MFIRLLFVFMLLVGSRLFTLPTGSDVVEGGATVTVHNSDYMIVDVKANTSIIKWNNFSVDASEVLQFRRNGSTANYYVLNKVIGGLPTTINGLLMSEDYGHIYLINRSGIVIGSSGQVLTGSFIASTLNLVSSFTPTSEMIFLDTNSTGITNAGTIQTQNGDVVLIGYRIVNTGSVTATDAAAFAAGRDIVFRPTDSERVYIQTSAPVDYGTGIDCGGVVTGKSVILKADGNPYSLAINHTGTINATGCCSADGKVMLVADPKTNERGAVEITGTIQKSTISGSGNDIEIYGNTIALQPGAQVQSSGNSGGGNITIGSNTTYPTDHIYIASTATIKSNGLTDGAGGIISVVANDSCLFRGTIESKGAGGSANGGNVYMMCLGYLGVDGTIDLSPGLSGSAGTFEATTGQVNIGGSANYSGFYMPPSYLLAGVDSVFTTTSLETALATSDVIADSYSTLGIDGDMDIVDDITWSSGRKLTLVAGDKIQVDKLVTMTGSSSSSASVLSLTSPAICMGNHLQTHTNDIGFVLTSGSIDTFVSDYLSLYGGAEDNTSAKLSTGSGTNTVSFGNNIILKAGSNANSRAEIAGTTVTINAQPGGLGNISLEASSCSAADISGANVNIGTTVAVQDITLTAGTSSSSNDAYIGNNSGASTINVASIGNITLTGGTSGSSNKAQIISSGGLSQPVAVVANNIFMNGGSGGVNNQAKIASIGTLGTVTVTTWNDLLLKAGTGAAASAAIVADRVGLVIGRDMNVTGGAGNLSKGQISGYSGVTGSIARNLQAIGGTGLSSHAEFLTTDGSIYLDNPGSAGTFTFQANISSAQANVLGDGHIHVGTLHKPKYLEFTGGASGMHSYAMLSVSGDGDVHASTTRDITLLGGGAGEEGTHYTHAGVQTNGVGSVHLSPERDLIMITGTHKPSHAFARAANGQVHVQAGRDMTQVGSCTIPNDAYLRSNGNSSSAIYVQANRDITQRGHSYCHVVNPNGTLSMVAGGKHRVMDCSWNRVGDRVFVASIGYADYQRGHFLHELRYRLRYYTISDWYLFHTKDFWKTTDYTSP